MTKSLKQFQFKPVALMVAACLAAGCSTYSDKRETDHLSDDMGRTTYDQVGRNVNNVTLEAKRAAQDVPLPYITGKAIPLAREVTLPPALRGMLDVTLLFRDSGDLLVVADRITQATGIPVKVMPDALLPAEAFMPRLDLGQNGGQGMAVQGMMQATNGPLNLNSPLPGVGAPLSSEPIVTTPSSTPSKSSPSAKAPKEPPQMLATALDGIAMRRGVYWKYDDQIAGIVFYRTETRTFEIRGAEWASNGGMSMELTGGVDAASTSGMASKSKSTVDLPDSKNGPMDTMLARINQFMTRSGRVAAGAGGMLVVTDTKGALDQIANFVRQENTMRQRRIDMVFEEITIEENTNSNTGVNLNVMFNSNSGKLNVDGLNSLIQQEGAALSVAATAGDGPWKGSSITMQALSRLGKIVDRKVNSFGTLNGTPATSGKPRREKYIDKLEQTQATSDASRPTVTVTQAEEVSGRIIQVIPNAYSDGDISLAVKFDNTPKPIIVKQFLPDGSYVQSPSSEGDNLQSSAVVRSGQPYVISAATVDTASYDEARTDRSMPMLFGGSDVTNNLKRVTVFVLTARVSEK
jgi:type IVB pilus formation R64 PilN family outer membrane protein